MAKKKKVISTDNIVKNNEDISAYVRLIKNNPNHANTMICHNIKIYADKDVLIESRNELNKLNSIRKYLIVRYVEKKQKI